MIKHLSTAVLVAAFAITQAAQAAENYYTSGRQLYDPWGNPIRIVGANVMTQYWKWNHNWNGVNPSYSELSKTGANACRIFWQRSQEGEPWRLEGEIRTCIQNKMIPIVALWDATGDGFYSSDFYNCVNYWRYDANWLLKKYQKHIILNITNEAGSFGIGDEFTDFVNQYKWAITELRKSGINCALMIDAPGGHDAHQLLDAAQTLVNHDPNKNVIFSWHVWLQWSQNDMRAIVQKAWDKNVCFVVGEFASSTWDYQWFDYSFLLDRLQEKNFGYLAWVWNNPAKDDAHSITWNARMWSWANFPWGEQIAMYHSNAINKRAFRTNWINHAAVNLP